MVQQAGAWLNNYHTYPLTIAIPVLAFVGGLASLFFAARRCGVAAFVATAVAEFVIIFTAGVSMFPFVLPSSSDLASSLTVWDCVSSHRTLGIMFWVALVMTPVIILYTSWAYRVMRGPITVEHIRATDHTSY